MLESVARVLLATEATVIQTTLSWASRRRRRDAVDCAKVRRGSLAPCCLRIAYGAGCRKGDVCRASDRTKVAQRRLLPAHVEQDKQPVGLLFLLARRVYCIPISSGGAEFSSRLGMDRDNMRVSYKFVTRS